MKIINISRILILFSFILQAVCLNAQDFTITGFEILPTHLDAIGKVKVNYSGPTTVSYKVDIVRQYQPGTSNWKPINAEIGLSTANSSNTPFFFSKTNKITNANFPDPYSTFGQFTFTDTIKSTNQLIQNNRIILGYRNVGASAINSYSSKVYDFIISTDPIVGTPPPFTAPVTGSVPLYAYISNTGNILTKTYYSSYPGYTYNGILGFLFNTQVTNTVPLYAFKNNSNVNDRYYGLANTKSGYTLQEVIGFVYLTPVSKTLPVNELYKNSGGGVYAFVSRTESRVDYTNNDVKFYMLQPKQNSFNPLPDDDWAEFYCYNNTTNKDHYYTMERRDFGAWQYESVLAYISRIPRANMIPLYEYFNHSQVDHFYTIVKQEYIGWKYSGIAGYVYPNSGISGTSGIHQYMNIYWDHVYTNQYLNLGPDNTYEGVKFYMKTYPY